MTDLRQPERGAGALSVATEVCIRLDGDEGLFASCSDVQRGGGEPPLRRPRPRGRTTG
jgi:hypothetical protein